MVRGARVILGLSALLWALIIGGFLYACTPAKAQVDKGTIVSDINVLFADNIVNAITAADLRFVSTLIVSSYVDFITCQAVGGIVYWGTNVVSPVSSPVCLPKGTTGQFLQTGSITPTWTTLGNALTAGRSINITQAITPTIAVSDITLNNLSDLITTGYLVRTGSASPVYVSRTISGVAGSVITTNIDGISGNTLISLPSISNLLDALGAAQGDVLFRTSSGWTVLTPGVSGTVLSSGGAGHDVSYVAVAGTGTVTSLLCGTGLTCTPNPIIGSGTVTPTLATSPNIWSATQFPLVDAQILNNSVNPSPVGTGSGTFTLDMSGGVDFVLTLGTTPVFANPVNVQPGRTGCIWITQPTTTYYLPSSFGTNWKFSGGISPTFTAAASAIDMFCYKAKTTTFVGGVLNGDFR